MRSRRGYKLVLALLIGTGGVLGGDGDRILGVWATEPNEHGYAHVRITGSNGRYEGRIIWLSQPDFPEDDEEGMAGQPKVDRGNPDPRLRDRPILGLPLLRGFRYVGHGRWKAGTIYDPHNGKTYKCQMRLSADGRLKVRGYVGFSLLGRTTVWTRPASTGDPRGSS